MTRKVMTRKAVYIAGPMSNIPEFNYPAFHKAQFALGDAGYEPINPARNFGEDTTLPRTTYLKKAVKQVTKADLVAVLDGWQNSPGARLEVLLANKLEIPVYPLTCVVAGVLGGSCELELDWEGNVKWGTCIYARGPQVPSRTLSTAEEVKAAGEYRLRRYGKDTSVISPEPVTVKTQPDPSPCDEDCPCEPEPDTWECADCGHDGITGEWCPECTPEKAVGWESEPGVAECDGACDCSKCGEELLSVQLLPPTEEAAPLISVRAATLDEAKRLVCGDRNNAYGPPGQDFLRTANILTSLGYGKGEGNEVLDSHDVAVIMIALKLSRIMWSPKRSDSWTDVAGYAGCGAEVAGAE